MTRARTVITRDHVREIQRLEKLLEDAGIKLSSVASDISGVSGRLMLAALIGNPAIGACSAEPARSERDAFARTVAFGPKALLHWRIVAPGGEGAPIRPGDHPWLRADAEHPSRPLELGIDARAHRRVERAFTELARTI